MMGLFPTVFQLTTQASNGFRVVDIVKTLKGIEGYDFSKWKKLTGSGTEIALTEELRTMLVAKLSSDGKSMPLTLDDD